MMLQGSSHFLSLPNFKVIRANVGSLSQQTKYSEFIIKRELDAVAKVCYLLSLNVLQTDAT